MLAVLLAALLALCALLVVAPPYLPSLGFPLDDAWLRAVYARMLARTGSFAYNPGIPATGITSPLWSLFCSLPYLLGASGPGGVLVITKLIGFGLHCSSAIALYFALGEGRESSLLRAAGASLFAFHPAAVGAALSGMEIPLATLMACTLVCTARQGRLLPHLVASALAPLVRPELGLLCIALPFLFFARRDRARLIITVSAAVVGVAIPFGLLAVRDLSLTGLVLPATFYAKVGRAQVSLFDAEVLGFDSLFSHVAIIDSSMLLTALTATAAGTLLSISPAGRTAAAAFVAGLAYCAVSFGSVPPLDPDTFSYQRYMLPALPLLVGPVPLLADLALRRWARPAYRTPAMAILAVLLVISLATEVVPRYRRIANDARNIDDMQVAMGRVLSQTPASDVVWASDAGAIRYFGNAFVVDLTGSNSPAMLTGRARSFLDAHPPRYLEIVPGRLHLDERTQQRLRVRRFEASTSYTVTNFPEMSSQWLAICPPELTDGKISVPLGRFDFTCAPAVTPSEGRGSTRQPLAEDHP